MLRQAVIAQLDNAPLRHQQVVRLDVLPLIFASFDHSVKDLAVVKVLQTQQGCRRDLLQHRFREGRLVLQKVAERAEVAKLHLDLCE